MSKSQPWYISHAETLTQNVLGLVISFIILQAFGMTVEQSIQLQLTFFVVSYIRSYLVRRTFERINEKRKAEL